MLNLDRILYIGPHCDDVEFACGGSVAKFIEMGKEVYVATFSFCEDSIPNGLQKDILKKEMPKALKILGVNNDNIISYNFPVRKFPENRQAILENLISLKRQLRPTTVFVPSSYDVHQDHNTLYAESVRAFKQSNIFGYEMPWNNLQIKNNFYIEISENHLDLKLRSIKEYKSQTFRGLSGESFFRGLAIVRGGQMGVKLAESFETIRAMI